MRLVPWLLILVMGFYLWDEARISASRLETLIELRADIKILRARPPCPEPVICAPCIQEPCSVEYKPPDVVYTGNSCDPCRCSLDDDE